MSLITNSKKGEMNAVDRILSVVSGECPDRVPIFPMIDSIPAELMDISIEEYYSKANNVVNGQRKLQNLLNLDYVSNFFYLAIETELFGMDTIFFKKGSPNTGEPIAKNINFFREREVPNVFESEIYSKTTKVTKSLNHDYKGKKPILSVQSGPFSLPSLLMGASRWFESLLVENEKISDALEFSMEFVSTWAKGHIEAGADIIVLVDGMATATSIPRDVFKDTVMPLYQSLTKNLNVPILFYTAGGNILPFADLFPDLGVIGVFPSADDDLSKFKDVSNGNYTLLGNLNNLEMSDWTSEFMERVVKTTMEKGKEGGYFVLATQHMIPHGISIQKIADLINLSLKYGYY